MTNITWKIETLKSIDNIENNLNVVVEQLDFLGYKIFLNMSANIKASV
jgi:hypothetical protein